MKMKIEINPGKRIFQMRRLPEVSAEDMPGLHG
jgi:hypothetical protein